MKIMPLIPIAGLGLCHLESPECLVVIGPTRGCVLGPSRGYSWVLVVKLFLAWRDDDRATGPCRKLWVLEGA